MSPRPPSSTTVSPSRLACCLHVFDWLVPDSATWAIVRDHHLAVYSSFSSDRLQSRDQPDDSRLHSPSEFSHADDSRSAVYSTRDRHDSHFYASVRSSGSEVRRRAAGEWAPRCPLLLSGTDDTSMSLAAIESFHRLERVDSADLRSDWSKWLRDGEWTCDGEFTDAGRTVMQAVAEGRGLVDEWSQGNGSLMRACPLALTDATDSDVIRHSAATHAHENCVMACVQWTWTLRGVLQGMSASQSVDHAISHMRDACDWESSVGFESKLSAPSPAEVSNGWVIDALETADWLIVNTGSTRGCLLAAVSLGGDTDTVAAIVGPAVALLHGLDDVQDWVAGVRRHDLLDDAAQQLVSL